MSRQVFTFPVEVLGSELARMCNAALEEASLSLEPDPISLGLSERAIREMIACGIAIAATAGEREHGRLTRAGLDRLATHMLEQAQETRRATRNRIELTTEMERQRAAAMALASIASHLNEPGCRAALREVAAERHRLADASSRAADHST